MLSDLPFFRDLAYVFLAALVGGGLAWLARQPLILGYVLGGLLISPLTPGPAVSDVHTFELFAEIGVILLMFSVGIEFSIRDLLRVKWVSLIGGPLGIVLSMGLGLAVGAALGWRPMQGLIVGIVISVASTMVLARLLMDRGQLHTVHGRVTITITLVEDLAVVILTVLIPHFGALEPGRLMDLAAALGKSALVLVPAIYLAWRVVPAVLTRVARTRSQELFLLVALAIGLGTAALTQAAGLSLALGAFVAGLIISESQYAHETLARLLPLRDTFVAVFFVTIGAVLDPRSLAENLPLLGIMVALVVAGKFVLWAAVVRLFRYPWSTALLVGVALTQIGEFSFVLVQVSRAAGHVGDDVYNATLATALVTILVNAFLVRWVPEWIGRWRFGRAAVAAGPGPRPALEDHVVICGFGRIGSAVGEALETFRVPYMAVDADPDVVRDLRARGVPCLFGDGSGRAVLEAAGAGRATLALVTIPDLGRARLAVRELRGLRPDIPILARASHRDGIDDLLEAGATDVIQPELQAAEALIRQALKRLSFSSEQLQAYLERFHAAMTGGGGLGGPPAQTLPEVREVPVPPGALADQSLRDARVRERFGVTVVAVTRADGDVVVNPPPDLVLRPGDRVRLFGLPSQAQAFETEAGRDPSALAGT
ncbi:MAG: cation:proton antiporter [Candidatus Rokuibacteriota bacterium]